MTEPKMNKLDDTPLVITKATDPPKDNLTFGVELEFAVATIAPGGIDPHPKDPRPVIGLCSGPEDSPIKNLNLHIVETLHKAGFSAEVNTGAATWKREKEESWTVGQDGTIMAPERCYYNWLPMEITSPPYYYSKQALYEIRLVIQVLRDNYRVSCNRSCGTHVHVGGGHKGFDVKTIKNVLATIWTFEPQIETIHPKYRVQNLDFCPSFRADSELARNNTLAGKLDIRAGLEDILSASSLAELEDLSYASEKAMAGGGRLAYHLGDISGSFPASNLYKRTIEFRQHKGTLDFEELELWIKFCVLLLQFADSVDQKILFPFLRAHVEQSVEKYPLERVLKRLGMIWLAYTYPKKIAKDAEVYEGPNADNLWVIELD